MKIQLLSLIPTVSELLRLEHYNALILNERTAILFTFAMQDNMTEYQFDWLRIDYLGENQGANIEQINNHPTAKESYELTAPSRPEFVFPNSDTEQVFNNLNLKISIEPEASKETLDRLENPTLELLLKKLVFKFAPSKLWLLSNNSVAFVFTTKSSASASQQVVGILDVKSVINQIGRRLDKETNSINLDIDLQENSSQFSQDYLGNVCDYIRSVIIERLELEDGSNSMKFFVVNGINSFPEISTLFPGRVFHLGN